MSLVTYPVFVHRGSLEKVRPVKKWAVACASLPVPAEDAILSDIRAVDKINPVLSLSQAAGLRSIECISDMLVAGQRSDPIDYAEIRHEFDPENSVFRVYSYIRGLTSDYFEIKAVSAAQTAALAIFEWLKKTHGVFDISIQDSGLVACSDGTAKGTWKQRQSIPVWVENLLPKESPLSGVKVAITVMSDRAATGVYQDESGALLKQYLEESGAQVINYSLIQDEKEIIQATIKNQVLSYSPDLVITSGGTGPGPRDITPEALEEIFDRTLDGLGHVLRTQSLYYTDTAWLSRMTAGMIDATFVIALPGSPKAISECLYIISPFLADTLQKIKKQGFGTDK